jgi:hypothetical protein
MIRNGLYGNLCITLDVLWKQSNCVHVTEYISRIEARLLVQVVNEALPAVAPAPGPAGPKPGVEVLMNLAGANSSTWATKQPDFRGVIAAVRLPFLLSSK